MIIQLIFLSMITLLMTAILLHPAVCVAGAASGLLVWFDSVLPSLFPFMVLTGLLIQMNMPGLLSQLLQKSKLFRRIPVSFLFAAITGLLCGYPMGIRTVSELRESNQLSHRHSTLLISFVNQPGPMFVLGYALPLCRLTGRNAQLFITAFYGGVLLTALISGLTARCFSHIFRKKSHSDSEPIRKETAVIPQANVSAFRLFEETVLSSMVTLTKIGGYMMLFSLILALLEELLPTYPDLLLILGGLLEMTSGIAKASVLESVYTPYLILVFLSFGGLCVTAQSFSLGKLETREQLCYLFWKSIQAILTATIFYLLNTYFTA